MSVDQNFKFFSNGIKYSMIATLKAATSGYGKTYGVYRGQLETDEDVRKALRENIVHPPFYLVAYSGGETEGDAPEFPFDGERIWNHSCAFSVVCGIDESESLVEGEQPAEDLIDIDRMLSDTFNALAGRRFKVVVENQTVYLTNKPLKPGPTVPIARVPNLTVYAQPFNTEFSFITPAREPEVLININEIILNLLTLSPSRSNPGGYPGVHYQ